jgi:hypothetical protein
MGNLVLGAFAGFIVALFMETTLKASCFIVFIDLTLKAHFVFWVMFSLFFSSKFLNFKKTFGI